MAIENRNRLLLFPRIGKFVIIFFSIALIITGLKAYQYFMYIFEENAVKDYTLYITEKTSFDDVINILKSENVLKNYKAFKWVAKKKKYPMAVKPGRYGIKKDMNTNQIVNILRSGLQEPVNLTFNNVRKFEDLAGKVCKYIQADSLSILEQLLDTDLMEDYGFSTETYGAMFIPNTYQFYWTTTARQFIDRMHFEYMHFWDSVRIKKASAIDLTPVEVSTLASIVQEEARHNDEKPRIAGVFLNRLRRSMALQADPTVKYAIGDPSIRRILNSHLETDSPYNTYINTGLPPGPITFPEISSIDAVLNYEKHNYLYFCAKEDFSGYHRFAATNAEHERNAALYRDALNQSRIYK